MKRMNKLDKQYVKQLDSIGFQWQLQKPRQTKQPMSTDTHDKMFITMFEWLKAYKDSEGHCCVPQRYEKDPALGWWVKNKSSDKKRGALSEERIALLDDIGFEWII